MCFFFTSQIVRVCRTQTCKSSDLEKLLELTRPDVPSNLADGPLLAEVVEVYCKHLGVPAIHPSTTVKRRKLAFIALDGLGVLALTVPPQYKPTLTSAISRNWQNLVNWVQYFGNDLTDAGLPSIERNLSKSISVLATIISIFGQFNEPLFNEALLRDEAFFKALLGIWCKSDVPKGIIPSTACSAFSMFCGERGTFYPDPHTNRSSRVRHRPAK